MLTLLFDSLYTIKYQLKVIALVGIPLSPNITEASMRIMNDLVSVIADVFVGRSTRYCARVDKWCCSSLESDSYDAAIICMMPFLPPVIHLELL